MKFVVVMLSLVTATCALAQPAPKAPDNRVDPKASQRAPDAANERHDRAADKRASDHRATQPTAAATHRRVVFLVDATGSMLEQYNQLRSQVLAAAAELRPDDEFGIVFDHDEKTRLLSTSLLPRDARSLKLAADFMEKTWPHGGGDAVAAFKAVLALRPTLIWYATDADFHDPNLKPVAAAVRAATLPTCPSTRSSTSPPKTRRHPTSSGRSPTTPAASASTPPANPSPRNHPTPTSPPRAGRASPPRPRASSASPESPTPFRLLASEF